MIAQPGTPATIVLYTDTVAAVVTRSTDKSVWVKRVELGPVRHENAAAVAAGAFPICVQDGITDQPYGDEERYTKTKSGKLSKGDGSVRLILGHSRRRVDYSY